MDGTTPQMSVHRLATVPVANDTRNKLVPFVTKPQIAIRCGHIGLDKCRGPFLRQSRKAPVSGRYSRQPARLPRPKVQHAATRAEPNTGWAGGTMSPPAATTGRCVTVPVKRRT